MATTSRHLKNLRVGYKQTKESCQKDWGAKGSSLAIRQFVKTSLEFLENQCVKVVFKSLVAEKEYFGFTKKSSKTIVSRPANAALFRCDSKWVDDNWEQWFKSELSVTDATKFAYTAALAPCLALEVFDRQNKKGPATFFEYFVGHVFAKVLGVNPQRIVSLDVEGTRAKMTMDFLFHLSKKAKVHLAVKMSTRERVVQAWAHQQVLNSAYGDNIYKGIMVLFGETKLDLKSLEVVEICVPDQWLVYQKHLSRMERIYYFDPPQRYQQLAVDHPNFIQIKQFGQFIGEKEAVLKV
ncbi:MAG TPA: hypothetical protein VKU37_00030 [Verrucomicrobiae bacterium]|nr:hypothetical protein [Verrucomicrobiae bacterium]